MINEQEKQAAKQRVAKWLKYFEVEKKAWFEKEMAEWKQRQAAKRKAENALFYSRASTAYNRTDGA